MKLFILKWILGKLGPEDKHRVLTMAVKDLYNTISADDLLQEKDGLWHYRGREMQPDESKFLSGEANIFVSSKLWKVLQNDIKYQANKKMYEHSVTETDLIAGKFLLYSLDCINTRLESMKGGSGKFNSK